MIATTFNILILVFGLAWFLFLAYRQRFDKFFILTPFTLFGFMKIASLWGVPLNFAFKEKPLDGLEILVIGTAFLAFVTGFYLAGGNNLSLRPYFSKPVTHKYHSQYYFMGVSFSTLFMVVLGVYYYQGAPALGFSVFELIKGDLSLGEMASFMAEQRFLLTKSHWFGGENKAQGMINITQRIGWRFIFAVSLIMYLSLKNKKWLFLTILTGFLHISFVAGTGERAPIILSFLFIVVVLSLMQKIKPAHFIVFTLLGSIFFMALTYSSAKFGQERDAPDFVSKLASQLIERIFLGNALHDMEVIEYISDGRMETRMGMWHLEKFVTVFPGLSMGEPLGYRIAYLRGSSEITHASGTYLGFVYADFGYTGVLFIFFFIGSFLAYVQKIIFKKDRDVVSIVISAMIIFYLSFLVRSGFIGVASFMVMVVAFWGLFHLFGRIFSSTNAPNVPLKNIQLKDRRSSNKI